MTNFERAKYGAAAQAADLGDLPGPFPRIIGPNATRYLQEVVDSGLVCDMVGRFETAFAQALEGWPESEHSGEAGAFANGLT
jgi:hypothetical protein